ncbi:MAG TPA: hypothetical protein VF789_21135 [Thermoanaerobaculia bacterium]
MERVNASETGPVPRDADSSQKVRRKPYLNPVLVVYGSLRVLTGEQNVFEGFDGIFGSIVGT